MAETSILQTKLGRRCRKVRKECGPSQLDMVRQFEFSLSHYQKIERGDLDPRLSTIHRLAKAFDMSLSEFLEGV